MDGAADNSGEILTVARGIQDEAASTARLRAGLTLDEAARQAGISTAYLRQVERDGASYGLARRLARLYDCAMDVFLPRRPRERRAKRKARQRPRGKGAAGTANPKER